MNDLQTVSRPQCRSDLAGNVDCLTDGQRPGSPQPLAQRLAFQELHHQIWRAPVALQDAGIDDIDDVGMSNGIGGARLIDKARHRPVVMHQLGPQKLDGRLLSIAGIQRQPNRSRRSLSELRDHLVVVKAQTKHIASAASATQPGRDTTCGWRNQVAGVLQVPMAPTAETPPVRRLAISIQDSLDNTR